MTSSAAIRKTSAARRKTSSVRAAATRLRHNDVQEIAESLVALGGVGVLGHARRLVEMFQRKGYPKAAAKWDAIATIMSSISDEHDVEPDARRLTTRSGGGPQRAADRGDARNRRRTVLHQGAAGPQAPPQVPRVPVARAG